MVGFSAFFSTCYTMVLFPELVYFIVFKSQGKHIENLEWPSKEHL